MQATRSSSTKKRSARRSACAWTRLAEKSAIAELEIGRALVMLADEFPEMDFRSPPTVGGSPVMIHMYVEDVDAFCKRAVGSGAVLLRPVEDQFYGDRVGQLRDPFGHLWSVASRKEDVSLEEMKRRAAAHGR